MASIVLVQAGTASSSLRCRVTYEASNGILNITKLEGCRTDGYASGANFANTSVNVRIGNSTSSYNIRNDYIQFPASNAYKTWSGFTGKSVSGLEGNTTVSITFSGGNDTLNNTSFSTTINAGYAATQPTVSASSVAVGSTVTINTPRGSSSYTHTLKYSGAGSGTIATGVTTSYNWTLPTSIANNVIDDVKRTITITCETFNGSTSLGSKTVSLTATIPSSYIPTASFSNLIKSGITTIDEWVQGKSKIKGTLTGTGSYGSTIKGYTISANNQNIYDSSFETGTLVVSGEHVIKGIVSDSRGRPSNEITQTITIQPYSNPSVSNIKFYRCNSFGVAEPSGAYVRVSLDYIISSVNNKNAKTMIIKIGNSTQNIPLSAYSGSVLSDVVALPIDEIGNATITIGDSYGTQAPYSVPIGTINVPFNINAEEDGVCFGGFSYKKGIFSAWDGNLRILPTIMASMTVEGLVYLGVTYTQISNWLDDLQIGEDLYMDIENSRIVIKNTSLLEFGGYGGGRGSSHIILRIQKSDESTLTSRSTFSSNETSYNSKTLVGDIISLNPDETYYMIMLVAAYTGSTTFVLNDGMDGTTKMWAKKIA